MSMTQDAQELEWNVQSEQSPFAEAIPEAEDNRGEAVGFGAWSENLTPFAEATGAAATESESDRLLAETFAELRDEGFDEALAYLTEETEQAVADRFANETPGNASERERFAEAQLSAVRFEAEQYLDALEAGLAGMNVESLTDAQLSEALDHFDPQIGELTPAGEEFVAKFIKKAKSAVSTVLKAGGKVVSAVGKVAGAVLGPVLKKLKALIKPLLRRVLQFAIGRLPAPLQPVARKLATRIFSEAEDENLDEGPMSPANLSDVEALAESFDAALAEAIITGGETELEGESFEGFDNESDTGGRELEMLAEARGVLIDRFRSANDQEDLGPAVEQFIPVLLGALRLGINLVGRPKVVRFLAGFVGKLIGRWVGPQVAGPLSNAIVDAGLRLVMLEAEAGEAAARSDEAGPTALASVVEDTVRRLAENEDYVFENEDLMQLAASEAFSQAVASHFPPRFVRPALQQAPTLGGTFIARRPRSIRTYRKYSRTPEVSITMQMADALPTFGGSTVGAALRAASATFPLKARLHIYQAAVGTTLPRMVRGDRTSASAGRGYFTSSSLHPLTPAAAGLLLREPRLGAAVPATYLQSRNRIAVGQRFYLFEPIGATGMLALPTSATARSVQVRLAPSRAWTVINLRRSRITVGVYLSEAEAQSIVEVIRQGRGAPALLQAINAAYQAMNPSASSPQGHVRVVREDGEDFEEFEDLGPRAKQLLPPALITMLRSRLRAWVEPALANWARNNAEAFARAVAHPEPGVTIRVRLTSVPGLDLLAQAASALSGGAMPTGIMNAMRGTPTIAITVTPGRSRK